MKKVYGIIFILFSATAIVLSCSFTPHFKSYKIDLPAFYADKNVATSTPLTKGKYIIGCFNPSCEHCRKSALAMHQLKEKNPQIPFFIFLYCTVNSPYDSTNLHDFWSESQAQNIPYACLDLQPFIKITGGAFPFVIWVNDGWVVSNTSNNPFDQSAIEKWMK